MSDTISISRNGLRNLIIVVILLVGLVIYGTSLKTDYNSYQIDTSEYVKLNKIEVKDKYEFIIDESKYQFIEGKETDVLSYNNQIPGPLITGKVGETIEVNVRNNLDEPTTVHWHGLQIKNIMDGVPQVTQNPINPGDSFNYQIELRNPGLYWYHSHVDAHKQVESGLQGGILVRDVNEPEFNDEAILILDDILLGNDNQLRNFDLGRMHGRFGNILLVNGKINPTIELNGGKVRLRIVNTANARSFNLNFENEQATVIGEDIGRVEPYEVSILTIHPGERYDLMMDIEHAKEISMRHLSSRGSSSLATFDFREPNKVKDINIDYNFEVPFLIEEMRKKEPDINMDLRGFVNEKRELIWSINEKYFPDTTEVFSVQEGETIKIRIRNTQGQPHPMHLHGQKFIVLSRNGILQDHFGWKDTVMVNGNEFVDLVFIAEEKGDWVFHCHILEHAEAGMLSILGVE